MDARGSADPRRGADPAEPRERHGRRVRPLHAVDASRTRASRAASASRTSSAGAAAATGGLEPDVVIVLDLARRRRRGTGRAASAIASSARAPTFHAAVRSAYRELAPDRGLGARRRERVARRQWPSGSGRSSSRVSRPVSRIAACSSTWSVRSARSRRCGARASGRRTRTCSSARAARVSKTRRATSRRC